MHGVSELNESKAPHLYIQKLIPLCMICCIVGSMVSGLSVQSVSLETKTKQTNRKKKKGGVTS